MQFFFNEQSRLAYLDLKKMMVWVKSQNQLPRPRMSEDKVEADLHNFTFVQGEV